MRPGFMNRSLVLQNSQPISLQNSIRGTSRVEYREYQKKIIEYEQEERTFKVPKIKHVQDYYPVEVSTHYIPKVQIEIQTEFVPVQKMVQKVSYEKVELKKQPQAQKQKYIARPALSPVRQTQITPQTSMVRSFTRVIPQNQQSIIRVVTPTRYVLTSDSRPLNNFNSSQNQFYKAKK